MASPPTDKGDLISVVIPAWNAAATIGSTLRSALAQSHRNIEVIVVDDGSRDETPAAVEAFVARDPRVRLLRQANAGVSAARNNGFSEARGLFLAPLDADDLWHPQKLARQLQALRAAGPETGLAYCWSVKIDAAGFVCATGATAATFSGDVYARLVLTNFVGNGSSPLIRRSCFDEVGGYDVALRAVGGDACEDWKLYLSIAERHPVAAVPKFLVGYRSLPGSTSRIVDRVLRAHEYIIDEVKRRHPELARNLFRWSRANFYAEVAGRTEADGRYWRALSLSLQALAYDPLCPRLQQSLRNLARRSRPMRRNDRRINLDHLAGSPEWPDLEAAVTVPPLGLLAERRFTKLAQIRTPGRPAAAVASAECPPGSAFPERCLRADGAGGPDAGNVDAR